MKKRTIRKWFHFMFCFVLLSGVLNLPFAPVPKAEAKAANFHSGLEDQDIQPTWRNESESSQNVEGICCQLNGMETDISGEIHQAGQKALVYSGKSTGTGKSFAYNKVFDVNIPVESDTSLSYWIYPQGKSSMNGNVVDNGKNSTYVTVDLAFDDGSYLHDDRSVDQYGIKLDPQYQGTGGKLALDSWNFVMSDIGSVAAGKTIKRILISYKQSDSPGTFRGFLDNIQIRGADRSLTEYVNPLVGTKEVDTGFENGFGGNIGNTFPGATLPFGMVEWSPDNGYSGNSPSGGGYDYNKNVIQGFSMTHVDGPGCRIGQALPIMPVVGQIGRSPGTNFGDYASTFNHANEEATPGYYSVLLNGSAVKAELTSTLRTGFGRLTYPATNNAMVLINTGVAGADVYGGEVNIEGNNVVTGWTRTGGFCEIGYGPNLSENKKYNVYFAAEFSQPFANSGTWAGSDVSTSIKQRKNTTNAGAFVQFDTTNKKEVLVKIGMSYTSVENAKLNLKTENSGWNFDNIKNEAKSKWEQKLNTIQVQGGTEEQKKIFYSALYHSMMHPSTFSDVNGDYMGTDQQLHRAEGYTHYSLFSAWDTYRSQMQLLAMLAPTETGDMAQSLVNDAIQRDGYVPQWQIANTETYVMSGDPVSAMIPSMYAFGAKNFNTKDALAVLDKTGTVPSPMNPRDRLADYLSYGYIPIESIGQAASITMEFNSSDFAISQFAKSLGDMEKYNTYLNRSQSWTRLFNPQTGYIQPKLSNGNFETSFNPASSRGFHEGNAAQYTWMIPHNIKALIEKMGGNTEAIKRLDFFFQELNAGSDSPHAFMGNEPGFGGPWTYNFAGAPYKTQDVVRRVMHELFYNGPGGIVGNDDAGATSSWYVFAAMGIYPFIPGVGGFTVNAPLFPEITINLPNCNTIKIIGHGASDAAKYIQRMKLNGVETTNTWVPYEQVADGGTLEFWLGEQPNVNWGTSPDDAPPSYQELGTQLTSGVTYQLTNKATNQVLEAPGSASENGTKTQVGTNMGSSSQKWMLKGPSCQAVAIVQEGSNKALDIDASSDDSIINSIDGSLKQMWDILPTEYGYYKIKNKKNGKVLAAVTGNKTIMQTDDGGDSQKWKFTKSVKANVTYKLININSNKALQVDAASGNVQIGTDRGTDNQKWTITTNNDGTYKLINPATGKALDTLNGGVNDSTGLVIATNSTSASQKWKVSNLGNGDIYQLINPNSNKAMDVASSGTADGTKVQIYTWNGTNAQLWRLVEITN
ncbi:GH92 family glycosyl hydrolase [Paenibacillus planticolens]|uniref:Ricin B lectin domain-containing protein n=1 Tax=Paenibacillus planticolens TaxID=2654976 RepID=A0ABX1ZJ68_9BACL|nr:GH92 family glycosyl hydrolase [Paenibacillus planticolens]NOU98896.1 hypothetical protein [Paenibacillus planticolens]